MVLLREFKTQGMQRILLPAYICESVVQATQAVGMVHAFYEVDLRADVLVTGESGDGVLLVHYFGWPSSVRVNAEWVIEDFSHALLSTFSVQSGHASFFSARKFSSINAGGWCSVPVVDALSNELDLMELQTRITAACELKRSYIAGEKGGTPDIVVEQQYLSGFTYVERALDRLESPQQLPTQIKQLLDQEDWDAIRTRRRNNWLALHHSFAGRIDTLFTQLPDNVCPLGFVLRFERGQRDVVRRRLMDARIYTAVHWPLPSAVNPQEQPDAATLSATLLTLPIDHRYAPDDMIWLADQVLAAQQKSA